MLFLFFRLNDRDEELFTEKESPDTYVPMTSIDSTNVHSTVFKALRFSREIPSPTDQS